jgi:hypothetical protein
VTLGTIAPIGNVCRQSSGICQLTSPDQQAIAVTPPPAREMFFGVTLGHEVPSSRPLYTTPRDTIVPLIWRILTMDQELQSMLRRILGLTLFERNSALNDEGADVVLVRDLVDERPKTRGYAALDGTPSPDRALVGPDQPFEDSALRALPFPGRRALRDSPADQSSLENGVTLPSPADRRREARDTEFAHQIIGVPVLREPVVISLRGG